MVDMTKTWSCLRTAAIVVAITLSTAHFEAGAQAQALKIELPAATENQCLLAFLAETQSCTQPTTASGVVDDALAEYTHELARYTKWLAIATVVLAAFGLCQLVYVARSDATARASATTLLAANRPWLLTKVQVTGFEVNAQDEIYVSLAFESKNIGESPANFVEAVTYLRRATNVATVEREIPKLMKTNKGKSGDVLFPDESDEYGIQKNEGRPAGDTGMYFIVCGVSYVYAFDEKKAGYSAFLILVQPRPQPFEGAQGLARHFLIEQLGRYIG